MCSRSSSCWEEIHLETQADEFRPNNTPGPLSIAIFFLGFIVLNHSIRRLFLSGAAGRERLANPDDSRESKRDRADDDGHGKEEEGTRSSDLMRMMLVQHQHHSSRLPSNPFARALLPDPAISISATPIASAPLPNTWVDSHRNFRQPFHSAGFRSSTAPDLSEFSDSCSESTTSA
ncbi:hypothetical protein PGT21_004326 [Puccinia graminis f. sp. tritici]|uniref:Uncharacterized protein n=1 Tax=Puccinia graminis f. sp. tritici TaxID=56615 RepID=A0A5B0NLQ0_PUCGR|nr:hypothetical protein PGT21_004326 [Puccinia graminis f. sp. tritici]KAA1090177.1 hypothetical protein PGTUg99_036836 [Puccinia graminis f. sp. tritici]